jgi:ribonuclease Z
MCGTTRRTQLGSSAWHWVPDVLFIECPFLEADTAHAVQKNHLTAWQAGLLARRARVGRLVPCHFSPRYAGCTDMLSEEAARAFRGSGP